MMPRSPSRDLADRYDGNRGYFHRPAGLIRYKNRLALAALALAVLWVGFEAFFPTRASSTHTHGALSNPHAMWDNNCAACHIGFSPADFGPLSLFRPAERWHALTCEQCHAGPPHHRIVNPDSATFHARCSNCHHEHGGRGHSLVRLTDAHCTRCHADLTRHAQASPHFHDRITAFPTDHPEFRELAAWPAGKPYDRRTLKFSHGLHLTPGLVYKKDAKGELTLRRLRELSGPETAARYRRPDQTDGSRVILDCASCHQLDSRIPGGVPVTLAGNPADPVARPETGAAVAMPRKEGAYYLPVNFDAHCKACHPLRAPAGVSGKVVLPTFDLPHGKQPDELKDLVAGEYSRRLLDPKNPAVAALMGPGGRFDPRDSPALATFQREVDRLTRFATATLFQAAPSPESAPVQLPSGGYACGKCHDLAPGKGKADLPRVVPLSTQAIWFPHALFNHVAHRGVSCASCHPGAGAAYHGDGWTAEKEPIQIAGIESCRQCHGPPRSRVEPGGQRVPAGGVRHGCTDCHRYHNGDHPLQGRGADARNSGKPLTPGEFSRGGR
jgi:hypothetical protein